LTFGQSGAECPNVKKLRVG